MWDLFDIVIENSRQEQAAKFNIGDGAKSSPQFSVPKKQEEKPISEQTSEEKRAIIAKGRIWLEKAKTNSQQS